jgi:oxalyl-CoA decarboxylase
MSTSPSTKNSPESQPGESNHLRINAFAIKEEVFHMSNEKNSPALTDGFHLVVDALKLNGLDTIYGVAGIPITDLARLAQAEGIRYIGFRHEQSAGNAAAIAGYLTRKPGICLTVSAPGFLNGMVALANATTNGFPMIQISGSSDRAIVDLQQGDYEELDQMNAAKPYAKAAYRVERPEDIGIGIARAIRAALSGRPGGVYLDLPARLLSATLDAEIGASSLVQVVDAAPRQIPSAEAVERALNLLAGAERPLIILGKGAAYAQADASIRELVEKTSVPFLPMSMAKGLLPDDHPQSAATARSFALAQADVVMLIGARLNWLLGHGKSPEWSKTAQFIQLDIQPTEIDSNRAIAAPVVGDIGSSVAALLAALKPGRVKPSASWLNDLAEHKKRNTERMKAHLAANPEPMDFYSALGAIRRVLAGNPEVYVVNEGANTLDIARNVIDMRVPRKRLDVGTWGVMGIGMGYAIAAAVVSGKPVVAVEGDSAFGFSGMEIETICRYHLPIAIVVFNNGGIYRGNDVNRSGGKDPSPTVLMGQAHYEKLIEAFGGTGHYVVDPQSLAKALGDALASGEPALINCAIDPAAGTESGHIANLNPKVSTGMERRN